MAIPVYMLKNFFYRTHPKKYLGLSFLSFVMEFKELSDEEWRL